MSKHSAWLDFETARRYQTFVARTSMYQELSQKLVELARIEPGMHVLDLGCGTGVTTQALLAALQGQGVVLALDVSAAMLEAAQAEVQSDQVLFIRADAAALAGIIADPLDRVVCNSLFWQFRHKAEVMRALQQVIKPGGWFVFNVPEPYFINKSIPRSPKVSLLFKQLAAERYGVGVQDRRTMAVFLQNFGFELLAMEEFERTRSAEESYLFFQLPVATDWMEPPLDYETRLALLEEAHQLADPQATVQQQWIYFIARRGE